MIRAPPAAAFSQRLASLARLPATSPRSDDACTDATRTVLGAPGGGTGLAGTSAARATVGARADAVRAARAVRRDIMAGASGSGPTAKGYPVGRPAGGRRWAPLRTRDRPVVG